METAFGLLECMEYFLLLQVLGVLFTALRRTLTFHSACHLFRWSNEGTVDLRTQSSVWFTVHSQFPFSEFMVLISAKLM